MEEHRAALAELLEVERDRLRLRSVGGGCISTALRVDIATGDSSVGAETVFAKVNTADFLDNFEAEADGLRRLGAAGVLRIPQPHIVEQRGSHSYFVAAWIEPSARGSRGVFYERFGRGLAELHRATRGSEIGLPRDNYLGAAVQRNAPCADWVEFVAEHRLGFQMRWAIEQGLMGAALRRDVQRIIDRLEELLEGRDNETVLLHGDLWSGNYLSDGDGSPVLIDPAVYHGCREAEFGMLRLFGGCPEAFYRAYQDAWPLATGWERRSDVYQLVHLLNHLNLFGGGYQASCAQMAARLCRAA